MWVLKEERSATASKSTDALAALLKNGLDTVPVVSPAPHCVLYLLMHVLQLARLLPGKALEKVHQLQRQLLW